MTIRKISKIAEYGMYLIAFLLPLQTRWIIRAGEINGGYTEYATISLYIFDIILILVLLVNAIIFLFKMKEGLGLAKDRFAYIWLSLSIWEFFIFVSLFFSRELLLALFKYGLFLLGVGLFWLLIKAQYKRTQLLFSFLGGIFVQAILAIWQFLSQSDFSSKWLGKASHLAGDLGSSVIETGLGERWLRAYGSLDHPNMLGALLVIGVIVGLICLIKIGDSDNVGNNRQLVKITLLVFYFVFITALFFTFSRAAWIALVVGVIVLLAVSVIKKNWQVSKEISKILIMTVGLVFILFIQFNGLVLARFNPSLRLENKSIEERIDLIAEAKEVIASNYLFGVGIGNYIQALDADKQSWEYQPVHNVFLLIWAEIGIFGLLGFLVFLISIVYYLQKISKRDEGSAYLFSIICAIVIMMVFDHFWWSFHFGVILFFFILGVIFSNNKKLIK